MRDYVIANTVRAVVCRLTSTAATTPATANTVAAHRTTRDTTSAACCRGRHVGHDFGLVGHHLCTDGRRVRASGRRAVGVIAARRQPDDRHDRDCYCSLQSIHAYISSMSSTTASRRNPTMGNRSDSGAARNETFEKLTAPGISRTLRRPYPGRCEQRRGTDTGRRRRTDGT